MTEAMYFPSKKLKEIPLDEFAANKADFDLKCEGSGCIIFTGKFRYLGSRLSWHLTDDSAGITSTMFSPATYDN